ncbi:hypothetical protein [Brevibacterium linens]|uniref:Uncharacterized protein n=1 Tax=Brevibacterium linens TaxID=1703 RepID=A0A2H1I6A8_BRELN|nr:hypothetical protein [Brevibacterium linens]SMX70660.1 hypothetical protein BLIN101_00883 [Brevibacterium linens]
MGLQDLIFGRTAKQRARRAEKIQKKFGSDPTLTPAMLEALKRANDVPDKDQIELYRLAVPEGAEPTRVSVGLLTREARDQVAVLFPDGLSILGREAGKQKNGEKFPVKGAQVPFWGIQSVDVRTLRDTETALIVTGNDGSRPYQLVYIIADYVEVGSFAKDLEAARAADAQRRAGQPSATVTSSLSQEEQLAALQQMREMTGMPADAYEAAVRQVREGRTTSE